MKNVYKIRKCIFSYYTKLFVRAKQERDEFIMNSIKDFWNSYKGAILGVVLAVLIIFTNLYKLIVAIILIFLGAFVGNYIQQNKQIVKDRLKNFIDRF